MPVEFLSDEQAEAYGTFAEEPTRPELERFFFLDDVDRDLIALRRTKHHQLGFALQMCTVRYVGLFLEDPLAVPWPVVEHLAAQLGIEDPSVAKRYVERRQTLYDHAWEIRDAYGYHPYEDAEWGRRFRTFLHGRAWTHAEGPKALFDHAVGWLRRHRVLPGVSVLARQVSEARKVAEKRLYATVAGAARRADPALPGDLVATLKTPEGSRFSELERLRRPPTRTTGTAFARALERVDEIGAFQLGRLRLSQIPQNRMAVLARYALGSKAPLLERAAEPKRTAMLTAVMRHLEAKAIDEALDLFQVLMATRLLNTAKERLSTLPQLEKASRVLARAAKVLFEELELELVEEQAADLDVAALWVVEEVAPRAAVMTAAATVVSLVPGVDTGTYGALEDLARNRVNLNKVITHWPDMLKVAGSLVTNQVRAYDLLRMFGRDGRPTPLGSAFAEYGRIAKTEHLLRVVDPVDDTYRRQMNRQLTVQESRHKLARDVCHGKRGTIHQAYRDGMEDQLGALGLVLNAIVLWTTKYIDAAVEQLRAEGHEIRDEDVARQSPLKHRNLNLLGRYSFTTSLPAGGDLRPLRDPDAPELDEDDDGGQE